MSRARVEKIVITNPWAEQTKGDLGILCGTIEMLKTMYPTAHIVVLRQLGKRHVSGPLRTVRRLYGVEELESIVPLKVRTGLEVASLEDTQRPTPKLLLLRQGLVLAEDLWALALTRLFGPSVSSVFVGRDLRAAIRAIREADLIVSRGGGYLNAAGGWYATVQCFVPTVYAWLLAKAMHRPIALIGQTVWDLNSSLARSLLYSLIDYSLVMTCREPDSYEYLVSIGMPSHKIRIAPCPSFALNPAPKKRVEEIARATGVLEAPGPKIGISIRYNPYVGPDPRLEKQRRYLETMANAVKYFIQVCGAYVFIVPQNIGPGDPESNDTVVNQLFCQMVGEDEHLFVIEADLTPHELIGLYGFFDIFIGTRLHACIFAAKARTPVVAISYVPHKTTGVMRMLGLSEYVLDFRTMTVEQTIRKAEAAFEQRDQLKRYLEEKVSRLEKEVWNNIDWCDAALAKWQAREE